MRKIVVSNFMTLDGVFEGPVDIPAETFELAGWTQSYYNEEHAKYLSEGLSSGGELLLGRLTYEYMQASWSPQTGPVADYMNNAPKYVVSNTLKEATWNNSTLISGNVIEEITKLKQQDGKDLAILGSGALMRSLMAHDLIDHYSLLIYPVVLGKGKQLFGDGIKASLKLKESRAFGTGVVVVAYEPERG